MKLMRLRIVTPLAIVVDDGQVSSVRAEDASGSFGVLPGHADFLTGLSVGVLSWESGGATHFCAVRGGVLSVATGNLLTIATREAEVGQDLATLADRVLSRYQAELEHERLAHVEDMRLQLNAIRQIMLHLRPDNPARTAGLE